MLELARKKVDSEGYISTRRVRVVLRQYPVIPPPTPKRPKTEESYRLRRISQLQDDIKDLNDHLQFKEKRREQATNSRNYKLCDDVTEEMSGRKEYETELHGLQSSHKKQVSYLLNYPVLMIVREKYQLRYHLSQKGHAGHQRHLLPVPSSSELSPSLMMV